MTGFALKVLTRHPQYPNEQHLSPPVGVIMQVVKKQVTYSKTKHGGTETPKMTGHSVTYQEHCA